MKKLSMLFAALLLVGGATFTSCGDDNPTPGPSTSLQLTDESGTEITTVEIPATGGSAKVYVKTDGSWDASLPSTQDWCDAQKGATRITVSAESNNTGEDRSTTLTVTAGDLTKTVTVTQPSGGEPLYMASYDSYLGKWTLTAGTLGSDQASTFTIEIAAGADYEIPTQDGGTVTLKGYDIKGWGTNPQLIDENPAYGVFMPSEEDQTVGYLYMLGVEYGTLTIDVPQEDGSMKAETSEFYFSPYCVNIKDTSKATVFTGETIMFIMGFFSDQARIGFGTNMLESTDNQQWGVVAAGYVYRIDDKMVAQADEMIAPMEMSKASGTSMASVSVMSQFSNGAKYATTAKSSFKSAYKSFNLAK